MLKYFTVILFSLTPILFFSCSTEDACENITCLNDGNCKNGTCECTLGYEGEFCGTQANAKFIGNYVFDSETCGDFESGFQITAVDNSIVDLVLLVASNNGGINDISISLDSATTFINSNGAITGEFVDESIILSIDGCDATYLKQ